MHRAGHGSGPRRPAGPLALAAAAAVLAIVALLAFKQWFVLPDPARSAQAPPAPAQPERSAATSPPADADRIPSSGVAREGPEPGRSDGESAVVRLESPDSAATPAVPEHLESKASTSPAPSLPAAPEPRSPVPPGRSGRLADKPPSSESSRARVPHPAPESCRGAAGLALAQCRACDRLDVLQRAFCKERTRLAYCAGRWGRVADCPAPVVTTPN